MDGVARDVARLERALESMVTTHTDIVAVVARLEAVVDKEAKLLNRVLDGVDMLEKRVDALEQRAARYEGWRAGAIATVGGGSAFGLKALFDLLIGGG